MSFVPDLRIRVANDAHFVTEGDYVLYWMTAFRRTEWNSRDYVYPFEEFEAAETHDELRNVAQRQLVRDGRIHNYLRMLWGKRILEWSATAASKNSLNFPLFDGSPTR